MWKGVILERTTTWNTSTQSLKIRDISVWSILSRDHLHPLVCCVLSRFSCVSFQHYGLQSYELQTLWTLEPTRLLCPWYFSGKNTGVGCHAYLQGIFSTQGWNSCLLHLLHWQVGSLSLVSLGNSLSIHSTCDYYE